MTKKASREDRYLVLSHVETNQTVPWVTEEALVEVRIEGEERDSPKSQKESNDLFVFEPLSSDVVSDLACRNSPIP